MSLKVLELFGGIGACTAALKRLNIDFEVVDYVEIDKFAVRSYNAINDTNYEPQDVQTWDKDLEVDLVMHGSPCQDFSVAGLQKGGDEGSGTRSSLMYETIRIVEKLRPKYVIWENVKNVLSKKHRHNFDRYLNHMSELGYTNYYQVLNAKDYGIPQNRERVFVVSVVESDGVGSYVFPQKQELKIRLKDVLEAEVEDKYYLKKDNIKWLDLLSNQNPDSTNTLGATKFGNQKSAIQGVEGLVSCLAATDYKQPKQIAYETDYVIIGGTQKHQSIKKDGICTTLTASMGTGGGYVPMITEKQEDKLPGAYGRNFGSRGKIQGDDICSTLQSAMGTGGGNIPLVKDLRIRELTPHRLFNIYGEDKGTGFAGNVYNQEGISPTLNNAQGGNRQPLIIDNLRIRKLTPKECWRLMSFTDNEFEKAQKVNSNTQLYKQAGNSIVVNVLVEIFRGLLLS